jgi:tRNA-dihydrouridine synthase
MQVDVVLDAHQHSPARLHRLLAFDAAQRPLAVQLGGRDPDRMAQAARLYVLRNPRCSVLYWAAACC